MKLFKFEIYKLNINYATPRENLLLYRRKQRCRPVVAQLISTSVFALQAEKYISLLNLKFQVSSHLRWPYSPVFVIPGRKPWRQVFPRHGSINVQNILSVKIYSLKLNVNEEGNDIKCFSPLFIHLAPYVIRINLRSNIEASMVCFPVVFFISTLAGI